MHAYTCLYRLRIWPLSIKNEGGPWTEKWPVSHTEEITCFVITYDSLQIITGSKDMSLKVWQINGGKLSQVCVTDSLSLTPEIVYAYRTLFQKKKKPVIDIAQSKNDFNSIIRTLYILSCV